MKRVLIFSLTYFPYVGGAEVAIKEITDRLDPQEYSFDMVTLRFDKALPKVEKIGNVTVYRIGPSIANAKVSDRALPLRLRFAKMLFPLSGFFKAWRLDLRNVYDLSWAMMANQAGFAALLFAWTHRKTPYLLELQDGRPFAELKDRRAALRLFWPLYKRVYLRANMIKAISNFIASEARSLGYQKPVEVIPNAVDVAQFSMPVAQDKLIELKQRLGKKMGDVFLFTASRLVLSRGVEDVIRALALLPENVKLLIAGSGEDETKLQRIAHDANVAERVIFAGHIGREELPAFYQVSDIFVRPSIIEGFGISFVEAFAAGIPVIATPVGGIPDFLFDPVKNTDKEPTGLFCNVHDSESIARAVTRYMNDPALVARMVSNAKKLVAEKYDWNIVAANMRTRIFEPLTRRG
ncbi:MAG: glycosyltransferase family 4 protein [Candidatus Kaiserbacteria bacterium]|nr:glycosyltransferase family 4 protein [Candidatus Kaiserbacteria bacterium]